MGSPTAVILGYGFTAQSIDRALTHGGYETVGVRRDWSGKQSENVHSRPVEANITRPETFERLPADAEVIVNCVSAGVRGEPERYRTVYYEGARRLLDWLGNQSPELVLWTSSSSVYGNRGGEWVDERSRIDPGSEAAEILAETERIYRRAADRGLTTMIFRVSGIYGPGRDRVLRRFRSRSSPLDPRKAHYYMNMVHRTDIGRAVASATEDPQDGETFNIVDNEPVLRREVYRWLAEQLGQNAPKLPTGSSPDFYNKRVSNGKFTRTFDFEWEYPTFHEGYRQLLQDDDGGAGDGPDT